MPETPEDDEVDSESFGLVIQIMDELVGKSRILRTVFVLLKELYRYSGFLHSALHRY